ncbi:MAG: oxidoreductase [Fimbriimonadales bacterium]|nr:MAG: oxidoreductase [Fimbriimonadales bacterium]
MAIGVGIVGYGAQFQMGKHHADLVHATEGLELRAIYDVSKERRDAARSEQPDARVYDSYEKLLEDKGVDLVVLVTPHDTHAPLSIQASQAGKHVMTEKVMCLNVAEADAMIEAARAAGTTLTVYQNRRWDGDYLLVREVWERGLLGTVFQVESSVNGHWFPSGWRGQAKHGGGMLYDWGAHLSDQLVQLMKPRKPTRVFATAHFGGHEGIDVETQCTVVIQFTDDIVAQMDVGCVSYMTRPRWLIRGEKAALQMPDWNTAVLRGSFEGMDGELHLDAPKSDWAAPYRTLRDHLLDGEDLSIKPEEVRTSIAILEAARKSAETGRVVEVSA